MAPLTLARFCLSGGQRWLVNDRIREERNKSRKKQEQAFHMPSEGMAQG